jgi:hypothetical protein
MIGAMKNPVTGVVCKDRKQLFPPRSYTDCFVGMVLLSSYGVALGSLMTLFVRAGHEALEWMMNYLSKGAEEALNMLQLLMDRGAIEHVCKRYPFKSDNEFYKFVEVCRWVALQSTAEPLVYLGR